MDETRLIPARAGKTQVSYHAGIDRRAHPRAGGENAAFAASIASYRGSSPRGRGKLSGLGVDVAQLRLIPARAGKTCREVVH